MLRRTTRAKNVQARVGLSFQQIQKYEKGKNCVGSGRLAKIAEALDVPVAHDSSVEGPHGPITGGVVPTPLAQHHAMAMLKAFAKLSPDLQLSLVVLVARMAEHSSN